MAHPSPELLRSSRRPPRPVPPKSPSRGILPLASFPSFTEDEIEELREAFNLFDTEGRGTINPKDLKGAMQSLGFETKNPIIYNIIAEMDTGSDEGITFDSFLNTLAAKLGDRQSQEGIGRIFELFDADKSVPFSVLTR